MKIEVIEKKREEAKETPFVVGSVYINKAGFVYVLSKSSDLTAANRSLVTNIPIDADYVITAVGEGMSYAYDKGRCREIIADMRYVPNARLVIDENEEDAR